MFASKDTLLTRPSGYNIARSVRFRSSASAYFSRTPASAGSTTKGTFSFWIKRGILSTAQQIYHVAGTSGNNSRFFLAYAATTDTFSIVGYNSAGTVALQLVTTQVFRDPSAWYHIVIAIDTTQPLSSNRAVLYINGVQVSAFGTSTIPAQNTALGFTNNTASLIGANQGATNYFDGYLTEINFVDGQQLNASSFGTTNATTGVWQPAKYTGTYGTNGFYLNFSDPTSTTTIGNDYSGNGNNWTSNNISVTAGATYDSMIDVPTPYADGGNGRGNYCVLNPLDDNTNMAPSSGNLDWVNAGATQYSTRSTIFPTSGKWYAEFTISSSAAIIAIANQNAVVQGANGLNGVFAFTTFIYNNSGTAAQSGLASFAASDVIAVAYDADTNSVQFYRNNSTYGTAVTPSATGPFCFYVGANGATCTVNANFGQRPFSYTPPTGFVALNTYNLPASTITNGAAYMAATTYTGTGSAQNITNSGSFQPDFVWIKNRGGAYGHGLVDSVRGRASVLYSNDTASQGTSGSTQDVTAFNSNGFALGTNSQIECNASGQSYIGWQWKAGGSSSSNTNGSITSTVSVGATQGFSVVTYTGTGANATVGHGLGVAPSMMIVKNRSAAEAWDVYHVSIGATGRLFLNRTDATNTSIAPWNNTAPTSTVFSLGTATETNQSASLMLAYCFAAVAGYSAFGSYTGNGSADGTFVYTGFRPRWVMIKSTGVEDWIVHDTSRNPYNASNLVIYPNSSQAEDNNPTYRLIDILSNGFKMRSNQGQENGSGTTYIYACFAESPFKTSLAR